MTEASRPDPAVEAAVARFGASALAWEVLRRDPAYSAAFSQMAALPAPGAAVDPAFARRWGLHFP